MWAAGAGLPAAKANKGAEEDRSNPQAEKTVRITKRHTQDGPRLTKKVVTQIHLSFVNITAKLNVLSAAPSGDGFVLKLTADEVDELRKLQSKLKKDSESNESAHCDGHADKNLDYQRR